MNQALIDQYVAGRLGEEEAEAFEAYCLTHPDLARQVEAEQLLRAGLAHVARTSPGAFEVPRKPARQWQYALAASVVLACGVVFYSWWPGTAGGAPILAAAGSGQAGGSSVLRLAMVRGGPNSAPVLPRGHAQVEVVGLFERGADYTVWLSRQDDPPHAGRIAELEHQLPATGTSLRVSIDAGRLSAGWYTLRVQRAGSTDEPLEFEFLKE